jgi:hypothetical protein
MIADHSRFANWAQSFSNMEKMTNHATRVRDQKIILATTNDPGHVLEKRFSDNVGPPLVRRLRDHCDCYVFEQGK